jgi:hypothetical protein
MDDFKAELNKCGCGGIKCRCCRPVVPGGHKDSKWTRHARRVSKQKMEEFIQSELEQTVGYFTCSRCGWVMLETDRGNETECCFC